MKYINTKDTNYFYLPEIRNLKEDWKGKVHYKKSIKVYKVTCRMRQPNRYWLMQIMTVFTSYRGESGQAILLSYCPINDLRVALDNHPETYHSLQANTMPLT